MELPRGVVDRVVYAFASTFMVFFLGCILVVLHYEWRPEGLLMTVVKYAVEDFLFLFLTAFLLSFIWCLFSPSWIERLLAGRTNKLIAASVILVIGLTVILVVTEAIRAF